MSNPLGEVFGFPIDNVSAKALRYRKERLCPFNNIVPNCTKDKANDPLGVCSVNHLTDVVITCPIRFREDWLIIDEAASFFFEQNVKWTALSEIKLLDRNGQSAGNIDYVIVSYDEKGRLKDFGSLEVQGVYITGNLRNPFNSYIENPSVNFDWRNSYNLPKPDYLSSSRKRLIPQMIYKGGIFKYWNKKQAVVLQKSFFNTLAAMPKVSRENADIAWFLYDLKRQDDKLVLYLDDVVYTEFEPAINKVSKPEPGNIDDFLNVLQDKLDEKLEYNIPDNPSINQLFRENY